MIHETAIIDEGAKLADDVRVGPYSIIGAEVEIGSGTEIGPHVVIKGPTSIGKENRIFQFASLGEVPQDLKFAGERTTLEIGDRNTIRISWPRAATSRNASFREKTPARQAATYSPMLWPIIAFCCIPQRFHSFDRAYSIINNAVKIRQ